MDPIVMMTLAIIFVDSIVLIWYLNKQNAPVRTTIVQFMGVLIFIPSVFLLSYLNKIDSNTVSTLMGAFAGYVFGKISLPEEWGGHQEYKTGLK